MRFSTLARLSLALFLAAPAVSAQSLVAGFPMGYDRAAGLDPVGTTHTPLVYGATVAARGGISESFDDITTLEGAGWSLQNLADEVGTTTWFQGNPDVFPSNSGDPTAYIGANFNSTTGTNTINTWLLTPETPLANGTTITFFTRTGDASAFPDRLEVRLSTAGASTNAGSDPSTVGDFTTLLVEVNPTLTVGGYPEAWTQFTATVAGLAGPTTGRVGFRYFVTDGGPAGNNSNFIGIDDVVVSNTVATQSSPSGLSSLTVAPNPVAGQGQVSLRVADAQDVRVALYDVTGREVMLLLDRTLAAGQDTAVPFQTAALPAGVYVVRATGATVSLTERITVVR